MHLLPPRALGFPTGDKPTTHPLVTTPSVCSSRCLPPSERRHGPWQPRSLPCFPPSRHHCHPPSPGVPCQRTVVTSVPPPPSRHTPVRLMGQHGDHRKSSPAASSVAPMTDPTQYTHGTQIGPRHPLQHLPRALWIKSKFLTRSICCMSSHCGVTCPRSQSKQEGVLRWDPRSLRARTPDSQTGLNLLYQGPSALGPARPAAPVRLQRLPAPTVPRSPA